MMNISPQVTLMHDVRGGHRNTLGLIGVAYRTEVLFYFRLLTVLLSNANYLNVGRPCLA